MIDFKVRSEFRGIELKLKRARERAQRRLSMQVLKDSNYYIPKDTGALETSGIIDSTDREVSWNMRYAKRLYWNPQFNFSKDVNPNARGLWFEEAKAQKLNSWMQVVKDEYK